VWGSLDKDHNVYIRIDKADVMGVGHSRGFLARHGRPAAADLYVGVAYTVLGRALHRRRILIRHVSVTHDLFASTVQIAPDSLHICAGTVRAESNDDGVDSEICFDN